MRRLLLLPLLAACAPLWAQQPLTLEPLPEPPPPAPGVVVEPPGEPPIRITPGHNEQIEEFVVNGRRVVRVTTPGGAIYYLQDDPASPDRRDGIDQALRVPLWVIQQF